MKDPEVLRDEFIEDLRDSFVSGFADGYKQGLMEATKWIPVTERLPEYDGWYLCTIKNDIETKVAQIRFFEDIKWKAYGWQVTAWMDEPEPYAESEG